MYTANNFYGVGLGMTPILSLLAIILFGCGHLLSNLKSDLGTLKTSQKMRIHLLWSFQDPKPRINIGSTF